jgi:hypothetical protein
MRKTRPLRIYIDRICHLQRILLANLQHRGVTAVLISSLSGHRIALCPEGIDHS